MYNNTVHNKIINLAAETIGITEFFDMLRSSNASNPIRIKWDTMEGNERYYFCYWDSAAYVGGKAGGSATKQLNGMYNLQVVGLNGDWRTIDFNTVTACRFNGKLYRVD